MLRAAGCHATFEPESLYVSREFADTVFVTRQDCNRHEHDMSCAQQPWADLMRCCEAAVQKSESDSVVGISQHLLGEHETFIQVR